MAPILIASLETVAQKFPHLIKDIEAILQAKATPLAKEITLRTEFIMKCKQKDLANTFCRFFEPDEDLTDLVDGENPTDYDFTKCTILNVAVAKLKKKSKVETQIMSNYGAYALDAMVAEEQHSNKIPVLKSALFPWFGFPAEPEEQEMIPANALEAIQMKLPQPAMPAIRTVHNQFIFSLGGKAVLENNTLKLVHENEPYRLLTWRHLIAELVGIEETEYAKCLPLADETGPAEVFLIPEYLFEEFCNLCYKRHQETHMTLNVYDIGVALYAEGEAEAEVQLDWYFMVPRKQLATELTAVFPLALRRVRSIELFVKSQRPLTFVKRTTYGSVDSAANKQ